uniref:Uncharacterized protein n=1 Tax=Oryza glumipatula TaxID=40148 RepID=A0A0D9Z0N9_9ORYZ
MTYDHYILITINYLQLDCCFQAIVLVQLCSCAGKMAYSSLCRQERKDFEVVIEDGRSKNMYVDQE